MKRDWMQTGRRPSGICGAALFVAVHLHGELFHTVLCCSIPVQSLLYQHYPYIDELLQRQTAV